MDKCQLVLSLDYVSPAYSKYFSHRLVPHIYQSRSQCEYENIILVVYSETTRKFGRVSDFYKHRRTTVEKILGVRRTCPPYVAGCRVIDGSVLRVSQHTKELYQKYVIILKPSKLLFKIEKRFAKEKWKEVKF